MAKVTINETHEVPAGPYCDKCPFVKTSFTDVGWEDGLGSPGTLVFYECKLFRQGLSQKRIDGKPRIEKCEPCADQALSREGG